MLAPPSRHEDRLSNIVSIVVVPSGAQCDSAHDAAPAVVSLLQSPVVTSSKCLPYLLIRQRGVIRATDANDRRLGRFHVVQGSEPPGCRHDAGAGHRSSLW